MCLNWPTKPEGELTTSTSVCGRSRWATPQRRSGACEGQTTPAAATSPRRRRTRRRWTTWAAASLCPRWCARCTAHAARASWRCFATQRIACGRASASTRTTPCGACRCRALQSRSGHTTALCRSTATSYRSRASQWAAGGCLEQVRPRGGWLQGVVRRPVDGVHKVYGGVQHPRLRAVLREPGCAPSSHKPHRDSLR